MNSIFQSYPSHPWLQEWTLEPRGCGTAFHEKNSGLFFQTTDTVGCIHPHTENPEWNLQIPIPQNSRINLMFNGFCGYYRSRSHACAAEVCTPETGVLWGRFSDIPEPVLISDRMIENKEGFQWLDSDEIPALLAVRDGHFCLVTKAHIFSDAVQVAERFLDQDLEAHLKGELEARSGAAELFERMTHHDALAVVCAESLMRSIRPPEGAIPTRWSQSSKEGAAQLDTNEIHATALAWRQLDPAMAEELLLGVLKLQSNAGAIPVAYSPHKTFSVLEAPKPMLAKTAEKIWETRRNQDFLAAAFPLLRRHIQWQLHHFDPKRRGFHHWQNSREPLAPEIYESEIATVDLTVLLLTEIEALNRMQEHLPSESGRPALFSEDRNTLENNLQSQFWDGETSQYSHAYIRDKLVQLKGFPTLTPLLWRKLAEPQRGSVLDQVRNAGSLPGGHSVLSWRSMAADEQEFPLQQQLILLDILETQDPGGATIRDFTRMSLQEFMEWHSRSIEQHGALQLEPSIAGFVITLMMTHHYRDFSQSTLPGFLLKFARKTRFNRTDALIVAATIFALWATGILYEQRRRPPPQSLLDARMNSAYANRDVDETLDSGRALIKYYPAQADLARLYVANMLMAQKKPVDAEPFYQEVRNAYPDSPGPMISMGLAYQLQGRFEEADKVYAEFCYLFDEIFPELVGMVQQYRYLMEEGFRAPPKWTEIYRYQLMHEL